mgnify:CR=1 FL=1|jgi:hypothetical protein
MPRCAAYDESGRKARGPLMSATLDDMSCGRALGRVARARAKAPVSGPCTSAVARRGERRAQRR